VIAKMTSKTSSYNRVLEAERKKVALGAADAEEDAADAIELRRAALEARAHIYQAVLDAVVEVTFDALDAWKQVARWRIGAWVDEQPADSHLAPQARAAAGSRTRAQAGSTDTAHQPVFLSTATVSAASWTCLSPTSGRRSQCRSR
jgi:hypothetical protein